MQDYTISFRVNILFNTIRVVFNEKKKLWQCLKSSKNQDIVVLHIM